MNSILIVLGIILFFIFVRILVAKISLQFFNGNSISVNNTRINLNGNFNSLTLNGKEIFNNNKPQYSGNSIHQSSTEYKLEIINGNINLSLKKDLMVFVNGKKIIQ